MGRGPGEKRDGKRRGGETQVKNYGEKRVGKIKRIAAPSWIRTRALSLRTAAHNHYAKTMSTRPLLLLLTFYGYP